MTGFCLPVHILYIIYEYLTRNQTYYTIYCTCSSRDKLGFYAEIQIIFGTVQAERRLYMCWCWAGPAVWRSIQLWWRLKITHQQTSHYSSLCIAYSVHILYMCYSGPGVEVYLAVVEAEENSPANFTLDILHNVYCVCVLTRAQCRGISSCGGG